MSIDWNIQRRIFAFTGLLLIGVFTAATSKFEALQQVALNRYGETTLVQLQQWIALIEQSRSVSDTDKLLAANDYFNMQIQFRDDFSIWRNEDYWATPLETIHKNQGDCEDFSLAKYVTLLILGIPEERIRLIYVQADQTFANGSASSAPIAHMVLAYYPSPNAEPYVLDNLIPEIKLASQRPDLTPIFSFNASSLWVSGKNERYNNAQGRLSKWQDVLNRIKAEGFFDE